MGQRRPGMLLCSPILACLLAILSVSLFSWGLGYKLSLYHSHQLPPKMAAAKLLSPKERPVTAPVVASIVPNAALEPTPLPSLRSEGVYLPVSELRPSRLANFREAFTVHTDRKPPPIVVG
jgi:hypothetical protein